MRAYDALLVDLDGTLLLAGSVINHASVAMERARSAGRHILVVTNNASRTPSAVATRLSERGIPMAAGEVVTSPQAAAALLASQYPPDSLILVIGADALAEAVEAAGLRTTRSSGDQPRAVVQGFSPDIGWRDLAEACLAIRAGSAWIATNMDTTLPTDRGILPGNGSLVAALATATGQQPLVAGKPERPLLDAAVSRVAAQSPLVVGDRLDTDIAAAARAGIDSLMVLTGVSGVDDVLLTAPSLRPTYIAADLRGLTGAAPFVTLASYTADPEGEARLRVALQALH